MFCHLFVIHKSVVRIVCTNFLIFRFFSNTLVLVTFVLCALLSLLMNDACFPGTYHHYKMTTDTRTQIELSLSTCKKLQIFRCGTFNLRCWGINFVMCFVWCYKVLPCLETRGGYYRTCEVRFFTPFLIAKGNYRCLFSHHSALFPSLQANCLANINKTFVTILLNVALLYCRYISVPIVMWFVTKCLLFAGGN
jgi:hypothetical protein